MRSQGLLQWAVLGCRHRGFECENITGFEFGIYCTLLHKRIPELLSRRLRTQIYLSERERANKKAKQGTSGNLEFRGACCGAQKQRRESGAMQRVGGNSTRLQRTMPRPLQKTHSIEP